MMQKIKPLLWIFFGVYFFVWGLAGCNNDARAEITKKHIKESYNLGDTKEDSTLNLTGTKFQILLTNEAYKNAKKNNFTWLDYGFELVNKEDGHPVRFGDTSQRFELHIEDKGFLYKKGKYRDWERSSKNHRVMAGNGRGSDKYLFAHGEKVWTTFSMWVPENWEPTRNNQTFFQFHSDKGPYPPVMYFKVNYKRGFSVQILTKDGMYVDGSDCGGSVKYKGGSVCNNTALIYEMANFVDAPKLLAGKWNDFVIYTHFSQKDNGEMRIWHNGKQIVNYKGKTLFPNYKGKKTYATVSYGIYEKVSNNYVGWKTLLATPSVVYYDEIWFKNKCADLELERLGYSCSALVDQTTEIKPRYVKE